MKELDLDKCFWREVRDSPQFRAWLIAKTKFAGLNLELVTTDKDWHQRWYKDPETEQESETDILLIFRDALGSAAMPSSAAGRSDSYALHIENKPAHGKWRPNQAESYRKRAINRKAVLKYVDFQTVLLAPSSFVERHRAEAAYFDLLLSYEDISTFVPEFATELN